MVLTPCAPCECISANIPNDKFKQDVLTILCAIYNADINPSLILENNEWLQSANAAGDGFLNLLKADASNNTVLNAPTAKKISFEINEVEIAKIDSTGITSTGLSLSANLTFTTASSKIISGGTSILFRGNGDANTNLNVADSGLITGRNGFTATAGNFITAAGSFIGGIGAIPANVSAKTGTGVPLYGQADPTTNICGAFVGAVNSANGPGIGFFKTRSTDGSGGTIVQNGDTLGLIKFWGANGTGYTQGAAIEILVNGTPGASNDMPASMDFQLSPDGSGTVASVLKLSQNKQATFTGPIIVASLANASAPNSSLYYSTDAAKLVYKDSGGVVNNLY